MRSSFLLLFLLLLMTAGGAQAGEANICRELASYVDSATKQAGQEKPSEGNSGTSPGDVRRDGQGTGTQGGGSVSSESSSNDRQQADAPANAPASSSAAPEPATSPHASSDATTPLGGEEKWRRPDHLYAVARGGDIPACRKATQDLRRGGVDLPASLIALAAYTERRQGRE